MPNGLMNPTDKRIKNPLASSIRWGEDQNALEVSTMLN
jgi:hypothetical protein